MTTEPRETDIEMTEAQDMYPQTEPLDDKLMGNDTSQVQHDSDQIEVDIPLHYDSNQNSQGDDTQHSSTSDPSHHEVDPFLTYNEEHPHEDPDSLFVPESNPNPLSSIREPPASEDVTNPTHVPAPVSTPKPHPTVAINSAVLDRIRNMYKGHADKKRNRSQTQRAGVNVSAHSKQYALDDDKKADQKAQEEFEKRKRHYDELKEKHGGSLPFALDVEWLRIKSHEEARLKKRAWDIAKAQESENDNLDASHPHERRQTPEEDVQSDTGLGQSHPANNISMQDIELQSMRVALEAENDDPSKKRKNKNKEPGNKAKPKSARKRKDPAAPKKVSKKQSKNRKKDMEHAAKQASSLLYSNIFTQQAGPDAAEQPFFTSSNKKEALKQLIASVPRVDESQARCDISQLTKATAAFSRGAVKPDAKDSLWSVRGMKTSLKAYQILGSAFMRNRENCVEEPRGGLLADQMGLGKTLMTLANILDGRPPKNSTGPKTTLIVASPALLTQWRSEIEKHSSAEQSVIFFRAVKRDDPEQNVKVLSSFDIVLATYTEVMRSYPKNNPPPSCETDEQKKQWWMKKYEQDRGALHRIHFLRVVLDEAQAIKNHLSLTSIACRGLIASHKWALSGTPIQNSLTEMYPYFKFIGAPYTGDYDSFKKYYCNPKKPERLLVRLNQFMLRRTHADEMFGAPILILPQANQSTYWSEFNPVERCVYEIVHQRFIERIMQYMNERTLNKSYSNLLVMMLRLRQLAAHILMLQFVMRDLLEMRDIERIREVVERHAAVSGTQGGKTIIAVRKQLEKLAEDEKNRKKKGPADSEANRDEAEDLDEDNADEGNPETARRFTAGGKFGKEYNFKPFINSLKTGESWEKAKREAKCGACGKRPTHPMLTSCGHLICTEPCYIDACVESAEQGDENPACKSCGDIPLFIQPCDLDELDWSDMPASGTRLNTKKKEDLRAKRLRHEQIQEDWLASVGDDVLPSAKTIAVKSQIMNWLKEDPNVKIIVYTQFLAMIQILERVCQNEGWKVLQYHGKKSLLARNNAIQAFEKDKEAKILLASLHCGGLGLNLTMASKVILIDPWWNTAAEQQAFCRVFRIGQNQKTYMSRLCVKATVDEKIMEIQERKEKEIKRVMEEGGKPVKGMSVRGLMELFGVVGQEGEDLDEVRDDLDEVHDDEDEF